MHVSNLQICTHTHTHIKSAHVSHTHVSNQIDTHTIKSAPMPVSNLQIYIHKHIKSARTHVSNLQIYTHRHIKSACTHVSDLQTTHRYTKSTHTDTSKQLYYVHPGMYNTIQKSTTCMPVHTRTHTHACRHGRTHHKSTIHIYIKLHGCKCLAIQNIPQIITTPSVCLKNENKQETSYYSKLQTCTQNPGNKNIWNSNCCT